MLPSAGSWDTRHSGMGAGDTSGWNGQRSINCYPAACLQRHRSKPQDKNLMLWHLQMTVGISDDFHRACQKDAFKSHLNAGNTLSMSASPPKRPRRPPLHTLVGAGPEPASGTVAPACQLLGPALPLTGHIRQEVRTRGKQSPVRARRNTRQFHTGHPLSSPYRCC